MVQQSCRCRLEELVRRVGALQAKDELFATMPFTSCFWKSRKAELGSPPPERVKNEPGCQAGEEWTMRWLRDSVVNLAIMEFIAWLIECFANL